MKLKLLSKKTLLIVTLLGIVIPSAFLFYFVPKSNAENNTVLTTTNLLVNQEINYGLPIHLTIPSINVDTVIEHVGLTKEGAMSTPKNVDNVAWFELGPRPGEIGSAVIDGHYGWENQKALVFNNLDKLIKGDKLYIEDDKGIIISFVVRETRKYDPKADTKDVFSSGDGKSHLNIITCDGVWNKTEKSYSGRLIVFTDREPPYNNQ